MPLTAAIDEISFIVLVKPQQQGSMSAFTPKGWERPIITDSNKNLKPYRKEVGKSALSKRQELGFYEILFGKHVPVHAEFKFFFTKPQSVSGKRKDHVVKPDLSKLVRSTEDALTGIIYADDAQITSIKAEKFYGFPERVEVKISGNMSETPQSLFVTDEDDF
jgi:Holliday junction resolvase RusA-like endonuclease